MIPSSVVRIFRWSQVHDNQYYTHCLFGWFFKAMWCHTFQVPHSNAFKFHPKYIVIDMCQNQYARSIKLVCDIKQLLLFHQTLKYPFHVFGQSLLVTSKYSSNNRFKIPFSIKYFDIVWRICMNYIFQQMFNQPHKFISFYITTNAI